MSLKGVSSPNSCGAPAVMRGCHRHGWDSDPVRRAPSRLLCEERCWRACLTVSVGGESAVFHIYSPILIVFKHFLFLIKIAIVLFC